MSSDRELLQMCQGVGGPKEEYGFFSKSGSPRGLGLLKGGLWSALIFIRFSVGESIGWIQSESPVMRYSFHPGERWQQSGAWSRWKQRRKSICGMEGGPLRGEPPVGSQAP